MKSTENSLPHATAGDLPLGHNVSLISSIGTTNRLAAACLED